MVPLLAHLLVPHVAPSCEVKQKFRLVAMEVETRPFAAKQMDVNGHQAYDSTEIFRKFD
jgi:hypothetical protein